MFGSLFFWYGYTRYVLSVGFEDNFVGPVVEVRLRDTRICLEPVIDSVEGFGGLISAGSVSASEIEIAVSQLSSQELELSTVEEDAVVPVRAKNLNNVILGH